VRNLKLTPTEQKAFDSMLDLGMSEEEALEVIADDREIDKGAKLFELDPESEKASKKARRADRKPNSTPTKRERKEDTDKRELIALLVDALGESAETLEVTNAERQIDFTFSNRKFRIVLSAPRS
jgi:hypothetical protein